jgi:hypothetical protein
LREIDVLLETDAGIYRMKIAVEAKDHSRPIGIEVLEQISAKYRAGDGVQVNQVVIVCRNGFTRSAREFADRHNILLRTLCEAKSQDWKTLIPRGARTTLRFRVPPHIHEVRFVPSIQAKWKDVYQRGQVRCSCCRRDHGTVAHLIDCLIRKHVYPDTSFQARFRSAMRKHGGSALAKINASYDKRVIELDGHQHPFRSIEVDLHFMDATVPLQFRAYEHATPNGECQLIEHGEALVVGKRIQILIPGGAESKRLLVDISDATDNSARDKLKKAAKSVIDLMNRKRASA